MAIVVPTGVGIVPQWQTVLPQMVSQPLQTALRNLNYLHVYHRPALVTACMNSDPLLTRTSEYHVPVIPSADGLRYTFETRFVCSNGTQTVNVSWDYCTTYAGGATVWTNLTANNVVTGGAGTLTTRTDANLTIPATAVAVRLTLTAPAAGDRTDHHMLVYPTPSNPTSTAYASGFRSFDDGLFLAANDAPVHTEWLNRCKSSAAAVLTDRKQMAFAFVQEFRTAPRLVRSTGDLEGVYPLARCFLPNQKGTATLDVRVIAGVSAGGTADLISLSQVAGAKAILTASGSIESDSLVVQIEGNGLLAGGDLQFGLKYTAGNTTRPFAVVAFYTPGQ